MTKNNKAITSFTGDYRWLSNFHYGEFHCECAKYNPTTWKTSEHAYQAAKATTLTDALDISNCRTPRQAKELGMKIKLRPNWDNLKLGIMNQILREKFKDPELARMLKETGDVHLEEGNNHDDTYWGTVKGAGENHLGKILMKIRSELNEQNNK